MTDDEQKNDSAAPAGDTTEEASDLTRSDATPSAPPADDAPAAEETPDAAEEAPAEAEPNPEDDLPWKERRRLAKSRRPHEARQQQGPEERKAERLEAQKRKATLRRKQRAASKAEKGPAGTGTPPAERTANQAKVRRGVVVSDRGEKSITVRIDIVRRHPTYEKVVRSSRTLHAHDERNEANQGDVVRVVETRPLSKTKRWRLVEVLERAK